MAPLPEILFNVVGGLVGAGHAALPTENRATSLPIDPLMRV